MRPRATRAAFLSAAALVITARGEPAPQRPDLSSAKPIATCNLQASTVPTPSADMPMAQVVYTPQPAAEVGLDNYLRSARGEWQMPKEIDRGDPWTRLLLISPKRLVIIDLAVFIDDRPFRALREEWIDDVLREKSTAGEKDETSTGEAPSNERPPQVTEAEQKGDEKSAEQKAEDSSDEKKDEPAVPTVAAKLRQAPGIRERLVNYLRTIGPSVTREEVRWLLAEWGSGPPFILLGPGLSWQRATAAPLLAFLDLDADGELNPSELAGALDRLKRADLDANDVVEVSEMRRTDPRPLATSYSIGHPLLIALDDSTNWTALAADLKRIYGRTKASQASLEGIVSPNSSAALRDRIRSADASLSAEDMRRLVDQPADVSIRVDFGTTDDAVKRVSLLSIGPELSSIKDAVAATDNVITLDLGVDYVEISAAGGAAEGTEAAGSQIAVGAVVDGDPLLRTIDRDQDGRLTSRERQALVELLAGLDKNSDGRASNDEIPIAFRLAITHGPQVHTLLASARPAARMPAAPTKVAGPDWFVSADLNNDGDLTPNEFIGTPEMFRKFDLDGDGRLSAAEAVAAGGGQ